MAEPNDADWERAREWCRSLSESGKHSGRACWDCKEYAAGLAEARERGAREEAERLHAILDERGGVAGDHPCGHERATIEARLHGLLAEYAHDLEAARRDCGEVKLHSFEVMAEMSRRNSSGIRIAPLDNIVRASWSLRKNATLITIGVPGNVCFDLEAGKFRGGLLLVDGEEFERTQANMEAARD